MISVEIKQKGRLKNIITQLSKAVTKGIQTAAEHTQEEVISAKNRVIEYPEQIADSDIKTTVSELSGRIYTDGDKVLFVEFGTGYKKDPDFGHIGRTEAFVESRYSFWFLPKEKAPAGYTSNKTANVKGTEYYIMYSQEAKPFFRTTAFSRRYENVEDVKKAIQELVRGSDEH